MNYLYNRFNEGNDQCALMRFFRTMDYADLTTHLQTTLHLSLGEIPAPRTTCLTLLTSRGMLGEWNDRFASVNHQVISLGSEQMIEQAPLIAQLIKRFGIDVPNIVVPGPNLFLDPKLKKYNVKYVPEALGDSAIVAQDSFVKPFKIRSVIGFGVLLASGNMFDLLNAMKQDKTARTKPFICFRQTPSSLGDDIDAGVALAASAVGASCYIDGVSASDSQVLTALQAYLPEEIWNLSY